MSHQQQAGKGEPHHHPGALTDEARVASHAVQEGRDCRCQCIMRSWKPLTPLIEALERLGIVYYIGGSVSSSLHGMARRTQDVDVITDIRPGQVRSLVQALQSDYYVDEQAWKDAVGHGLPYNLIHLGTMLKVDLIPLKQRAFTSEEARRAQPHILEAGTRPVRVASAEDAILTKLEWFEMGGCSSTRQWNDLLGIMRQQGTALDVAYLTRWADVLGVRDLPEQELGEAGLRHP